MTLDRRRFLQLSAGSALAVGAGGLLAACGSDADSSTDAATSGSDPGSGSTAAELTELTAMMPFPVGLNFIADTAAVSGGYFEDNGLDVDLQFAQSAPAALQQLAAGNVDVVRNAPLAVVKAVSSEDAPFVVIAMPNQEVLYRLVSTSDDPVDSLEALEGKTVGMATVGGNAENTLDLMLKGAGLDPESVKKVAVGNDAAALAFVQENKVDALFATLESTASMQAAGQEPHIADLQDVNPLLGTAVVTTKDKIEQKRDALVAYLRSVDQSMNAVMDADRRAELLPEIEQDFDLPQLQDPDKANPVIDAITTLWVAAGVENLLRNVPERWAEGVTGFEKLKIAKEGSDPTTFYTNDLLDEATS
jgi:NitT/TauT family transport system substrate-binding protein